MGKHDAPKNSRRKTIKVKIPELKAPKLWALPKLDLSELRVFFERLAAQGLEAEEQTTGARHRREARMDAPHVGRIAASSVIFFVLALLPTYGWLRFALFVIPYLILALEVMRDAIGEILDKEFPGRNLIVTAAGLACIFLGDPRSAVFIVLLYQVGRMAEAWVQGNKREAAAQWKAQLPTQASVENGEGVELLPVENVQTGEIILVRAGEQIPLDGLVIDGTSTIDLSALTGDTARPRVSVGSSVYAGTMNLDEAIRVRVTDTYPNTQLYRTIRAVEEGANSQARADRVARYLIGLIPTVFSAVALICAILVPLFTGAWRTWITRGVYLLAIAGNAQLLMSLGYSYFDSIYRAARQGIAVRSADALNNLADAGIMIFSKNGTVTEGQYSVTGIYPEQYSEQDLLSIAALAECQSQHPIARALRQACGIGIHSREDIKLLEEQPGRGVSTLFSDRHVYVGNASFLSEHGVQFDTPAKKGTVIHVAVDNEYAGHIVLTDRVRDGSFDAIEELRVQGIKNVVMLTGDVRTLAHQTASSLGFDMVKYELNTQGKISTLEYLRAEKGGKSGIAYVTSKMDEGELMERADTAIFFPALGVAKALDVADIAVLDENIAKLPLAMRLAKRNVSLTRINLFSLLGLKLLLAVLGLCGVMQIWPAVLLETLAFAATLAHISFRR